jgi:transcriptional regulator with XRE-family HTH domain
MVDFKHGIERVKTEKRITQRELGELLGMAESNASRFFKKNDPRLYGDICKIADALGYNVELVFVDKETGKRILFD